MKRDGQNATMQPSLTYDVQEIWPFSLPFIFVFKKMQQVNTAKDTKTLLAAE